jgi:hypothetical protein
MYNSLVSGTKPGVKQRATYASDTFAENIRPAQIHLVHREANGDF